MSLTEGACDVSDVCQNVGPLEHDLVAPFGLAATLDVTMPDPLALVPVSHPPQPRLFHTLMHRLGTKRWGKEHQILTAFFGSMFSSCKYFLLLSG